MKEEYTNIINMSKYQNKNEEKIKKSFIPAYVNKHK